MSARPRILFTEGASLSARQTLYPLGASYDIDILDPDPLCQCRFSSYAKRFFRSPHFAQQPAEFMRFLLDHLHRHDYDAVLPTHEQVYLLSRFRDVLSEHVAIALPDFAALEQLQNKANFSRLLTRLDLPQPETLLFRPDTLGDPAVPYPLYLKLAHSTAGGGVFHIENRSALDKRLHALQREGRLTNATELMLQQPARGVLSTVQAVFSNGEAVGIHMFEARRLGVGGMSTARVSACHDIVREQVVRLGRELKWHGAFFLDYFYDHQTGRPEYIEANPRIGETVNAWRSGTNLAELLIRVSRGENPPELPPGRAGVRTHNGLMILMSMAYDGATRSALLRERSLLRRKQGSYDDSEDELTRPQEDPWSRLPRLWITSQLLAWPAVARRIVRHTVENYSLPESATQQIKSLQPTAFEA